HGICPGHGPAPAHARRIECLESSHALAVTAASRMAPWTTWTQKADTPIRTIPLRMTPKTRAPMTVPTMDPLPPNSAVPPRTTTVMTSSSKNMPVFDEPEANLEASINPAMAEHTPEKMYTLSSTRLMSTPERRSDSLF